MKGGFAIWLFAIPWTAFALFWESFALLPWLADTKTPSWAQMSFGIIFPLFGLPFILVGLWMLWRPVRAVKRAHITVYGLTDKRLIRLVTGPEREIETVMINQIGPIECTEQRDTYGHLRIQTHSHIDSDGDRITERFEVIGVPEVSQLHRLILQAAQSRI